MQYYPYKYLMDFPGGGDEPYIKKKLFTFDSPRSHQGYMVWVEVYENHFYAVKFHLRRDKNNPNRYSVMSGYGEARPVINTCMRIMMEIGESDPLSSFGFIGAHMEDESECNTKRHRVYCKIVATYFSDVHFKHLEFTNKSAYVLLRRRMLELKPDIEQQMQRRFMELYPYFE